MRGRERCSSTAQSKSWKKRKHQIRTSRTDSKPIGQRGRGVCSYFRRRARGSRTASQGHPNSSLPLKTLYENHFGIDPGTFTGPSRRDELRRASRSWGPSHSDKPIKISQRRYANVVPILDTVDAALARASKKRSASKECQLFLENNAGARVTCEWSF